MDFFVEDNLVGYVSFYFFFVDDVVGSFDDECYGDFFGNVVFVFVGYEYVRGRVSFCCVIELVY